MAFVTLKLLGSCTSWHLTATAFHLPHRRTQPRAGSLSRARLSLDSRCDIYDERNRLKLMGCKHIKFSLLTGGNEAPHCSESYSISNIGVVKQERVRAKKSCQDVFLIEANQEPVSAQPWEPATEGGTILLPVILCTLITAHRHAG